MSVEWVDPCTAIRRVSVEWMDPCTTVRRVSVEWVDPCCIGVAGGSTLHLSSRWIHAALE